MPLNCVLKKQCTTHKVLKRIDVFGAYVPSFNLKGKSTIHTITGGFFSVVIALIVLAYANFKFI